MSSRLILSLLQEVKTLGGLIRKQTFSDEIFGMFHCIMLTVFQLVGKEGPSIWSENVWQSYTLLIPTFKMMKMQYIELKWYTHSYLAYKWLYPSWGGHRGDHYCTGCSLHKVPTQSASGDQNPAVMCLPGVHLISFAQGDTWADSRLE